MDTITSEQIGKPILAADAILAVMKKDKRGIFIGVYINPEDMNDATLRVNIGDVMRIFLTVPELGA